MIDIFSDKLFRMELARLASDKVVTQRAAAHNEFQRLMVKLNEAQEAPKEVRSWTGPYMRIPIREPVHTERSKRMDKILDMVVEINKLVGAAPQSVKSNVIPSELYDEMRDWLVTAQRSLTNPLLPEYYRTKLKEYQALFTDKLNERQHAPPNRTSTLRWNRFESGWERGVAQGRVA